MSIKKNFLYNFVLTVSNYVFPIFTYPYVSRILGVSNIGICHFVDSIINYFLLFSMMGLTTIGIREIAKNKNDRTKLNESFTSIVTLNILLMVFAIGVLLILTYSVERLAPYKELMFYGIFKIIFNVFLIEWFFQGIENFKYITLRSIIIKFLYLVSIFILIRSSEDYNIYYLLSVLMVVSNSIINWRYKSQFVSFTLRKVSIRPILKSTFTLGFYKFLTSMYTTFNVAYLGFISNEIQVGFYTTAVKFHSIIIALFSAFTGVMLPRMSDFISNNNLKQFNSYTNKSLEILFSFSFPLIFGMIVLAPEIILLFSGKGFEGAIVPLKIVAPLVLIIGLEQIFIVQMLTPLRRDNAILFNSIIGALIGLSLNVLLVNKFLSVGTSLVWLVSECCVLLSALYFVKKYLNFSFNFILILKNIVVALPVLLIAFWSKRLFESNFIILINSIIFSSFYLFVVQFYILKNDLVINTIKDVRKFLVNEK